MIFNIDMIRKKYSEFADKVQNARNLVGHPLTLAEKILYTHLFDKFPSAAYKRGVDYVKKVIGEICEVLGVKDAYSADKILTELIESIGLKTKLKDLNIKYKDLDFIVSNVNLERVKNNPRLVKQDELKTMLEKVYD